MFRTEWSAYFTLRCRRVQDCLFTSVTLWRDRMDTHHVTPRITAEEDSFWKEIMASHRFGQTIMSSPSPLQCVEHDPREPTRGWWWAGECQELCFHALCLHLSSWAFMGLLTNWQNKLGHDVKLISCGPVFKRFITLICVHNCRIVEVPWNESFLSDCL